MNVFYQTKHRILRLFAVLLLIACAVTASAQNKTVTGKIIDAGTGEAVIGATVLAVGTSNGVAADLNGTFKIVVPANASLQFKSIGYTSVTVAADFDKPMIIKLEPSNKGLEEVVVVGYGQQKRATVSGAVATVSSKVFQDRGPINNPLESLQGQVPGVVVTRTSAQPGRENWNFQIRGATSTNTQDPLIVLDGVALVNNAELNSINPNDIDNISFLKDAAASIYGARAAFGVVLITTKKAKSGKMDVQYLSTISQKRLGLQPILINNRQWGQSLKEALTNDNYGVAPTSYLWYQLADLATHPPDSLYIDITKLPGYAGSANGVLYNGTPLPSFGDVKDFTFFDTNMQKMLWGNATSTQQDLSFSGSGDRGGYRVSLGYLNDGSQLKWGLNGNQRYNLRLNHSYKFSDRVNLETNISLERNNIQQPTLYSYGGYSALSNYGQPGLPAFTSKGQPYAWGTVYSAPALLKYGGDNKESNSRALLNSTFTYNFAKHLTFTAVTGYHVWYQDSRIQQKQVQFYNYAGNLLIQTNPINGGNGGSNTFYNRSNITEPYYNLAGRVSYDNVFNKVHAVGVMLGSSYERDEYNYFTTRTYNLGSDDIPSLGTGVTSGTAGFVTNGETQNHYALGSYFGRATYTYNSKYNLEVQGRYDGSSKFIADKRWKIFGSVLGSWLISEEPFVKNLNIFSTLKLRASYGTTGSQSGIGLYDYLQSLNVNTGGALLGNNLATSVTTTGSLVSLNRTWETVVKKNLALDFGILNDHLSGSFDIYRNQNNNMLLNQLYPGVLGASAPTQNIGTLHTWGYEGSLTWRSNIGKLTYSISGTITDNQNKLVHFGGANVIGPGYNATVEGYPLGSYFGLKYGGKLQTQAEVDAYNAQYAPTGSTNNIGLPIPSALANPAGQMSGLRPGDNKFVDVNGDGKLSIGGTTADKGDLVYLGSDNPRYSYGLNLGLQWNGFDFYSIFQGVGKRAVLRTGSSANFSVPFLSIFQGQTTSYLGNVWSPENPDAYYPNLHSAQNNGINNYNYQPSTWRVQNGAYVRLKNVVLGYTIPKSLLAHTHAIKGLRVYFSGSDLWEKTYIHDGWDPEVTRTVAGNERYPFYRYLTLGVNVTF